MKTSLPIAYATGLVLAALSLPLAAQTTAEIVNNGAWTVYDVGHGVTARTCHFDNLFGGQQDVCVAEGDLTSPGVSLKFVGTGDGTRKTVTAWAATVPNAAAAINGAWFNGTTGLPDQFLRIGGVTLALTNPVAQERGGVVIAGGGQVTCREHPASGWASLGEPNVMASEVPSVVNGQPFEWTPAGASDYNYYYVNRAPRTAVGVKADGRVLLLVVDGRRAPAAIGVTYAQVADLMIALGAVNATELDGGGSSTLWGRGCGVLNQPSDGQQRSVALSLCLVANPVIKPYDAKFTGATYQPTMTAGTTQSVTMEFLNTGTAAWDAMTHLGTTEPRDRNSSFTGAGWLGPNRPCGAEQPAVAPGQTGRFSFVVQGPAVASAQTLTEAFGLVQEGVTWFGPEQNRLSITVAPEGGIAVSDIIVESRAGGQNTGWYSESGGWADSGAQCTVTGATAGIGMRYGSTSRSVAGLKVATYRPVVTVAGQYEVFAAWGAASNRRWPITYKVTDNQGTTKTLVDQAATANVWLSLGLHNFDAGSGGDVQISNEDIDTAGSMFAGPVKFQFVRPAGVRDWHLHE